MESSSISNSGSTADNRQVANDDDRVMNDTTMPPPSATISLKQDQIKELGDEGNAKKYIPTTNSSIPIVIPESVRKKVGKFGLSDWNRLLSVSKDLAQLKGQPVRNAIPWKEIKKHNSVHDGWMVLKNKVYNISPYLAYHPGGEKILRGCLGNDATALFTKYHMWVNEERLIGKLYIGNLDKSTKYDDSDDEDSDDE